MAVSAPSSSPSSSSPPPSPAAPPRSLPRYLNFYGKHRKQAELQILNREIGFLQEELRSLEGLQPASRCCKEVDEFVGMKPDPLTPLNRKVDRSCCIWKWLRPKSCFNMSWICCFGWCTFHPERSWCGCGPLRKWQCCCHCCCLEKSSCRRCCVLPALSCPHCSCSCLRCCPRCRKVFLLNADI
ncbi:guanine nucleotide-binding protein subunit gamma 3-like isoform X2 [Magnolia sinica]|uniref:guanine nucleotide-binding protein subunit gamma 3-like isoform X2 n=1 Tax=Magnolia sinica TaxID=86752 RepID=UPI0026599FE1|nr:guanine nucleotide-binding protein subunit gamma 3-like isoform X2 [Magnolia sinica]